MDGLSAAASIWSLAQATGALIKYFNATKSAPKDMSKLQKELATLNSLLITLINLKFHFENSETSKEWNSAIRTLGVEHGPFAECADTMAQLHEKVTRKGLRTIATWAFIKDDVHDMLDKIERLKTAINLVLSADQLKLSNLMYTQVKELGNKLDNNHNREQVREALNWISTLNFRSQQARHKSLMEQDTGAWFLRSQGFESWVEQPSQTLFCPGIPGAGKTIMVAAIVNHLESNVLDQSIGNNLAYVFCDYKDEKVQSVDQLLGSLLQQLVQNNHELAGPLIALHEAHAEKKSFPSVDELVGVIQSVISNQTAVYIVIDAIDECPQRDRKRRQLLNSVLKMHTKTDALHLLVTSRFSPDVVEAFKDIPSIEVKADVDDLRRYVHGRFGDFKARLSDDWRVKVEDAIIGSTNGMFLLARFLVDRFASLHTLKHVKALVNELAEGSNTPKTTVDVYREMYEGTLDRIEDQAQSDRELAKKVLMWLSNVARLLTTQELCTALSIDPEDTEFDEDNLLDTELIVSVCAGLVIVEGESGIVRLVHYTAQEYFDNVGQDRRAKEQEELAKTCLTYLCFEDFKPGPHTEMRGAEAELFRMRPGWLVHYVGYGNSNGGCASYNSVRSGEVESVPLPDSDRSATFLDYAANHWFLHAKGCQVPIAHLALRLLKHQPLAAHAFHKATILHSRWAFLRNSAELASTRTTGLHLVAAAGLTQVCREFLTILDADQVNDRHIHADAKDDGGRTALMWAAHHGHYDIVELLLDRCDQMNDWPRTRINDVRHDRIDHRGDTALNYAARQGHLEVVRLLTRPDKIMAYVIMTLYWNWNHYTITEEEYLKKCIRHENAFGETAVVQAALEGHEEVVTLLKQQDTLSLHREVMFGLWPIHIAAQRRPVAVMKLLLDECGIEAYIEDPKGYSPFVVAADWNNEDIVRYFLTEKRAVLEKKPEMVVQGAKVAAANWKREAILRLILEKAGSILDQNHLEAILEVAVSAGNVSIAIYLAAQKATYESSENDAVPGGTTA